MGVNQSALGCAAGPASLFSLADWRAWRRGRAVAVCYHVNTEISTKYELSVEILGTGMSGPVMRAQGKVGTPIGNREFAVKRLRKANPAAIQMMKKEVLIMLSLDHPNIARIEDVFDMPKEIYMVMEKLEGGELFDRVVRDGAYAEGVAAEACRSMCGAVSYLHSRTPEKIVHRDLKPENFLYLSQTSNHLKLIDFGLSAMWAGMSKGMQDWCGTTGYKAPEVMRQLPYTEKCDCFSLGVIAYIMLTGHPPFESSLDFQRYKPFEQTSFTKTSQEAQNFVRGLLELHPERRLSASAALEHEWLREGKPVQGPVLDVQVFRSMQRFSTASRFKRMCLSMLAWSLTEKDREELCQKFTAMDTNGNGRISLTEMRVALQENFDINSNEAETLFANLVGVEEEEIAYSDFLAAAMQQRVRTHEAALWDTFSRIDRGNKGKITAEDLSLMLDKGFGEVDVAAILREVDREGRGWVTHEAFVAYLTRGEEDFLAARLIDRQREHEQQDPEAGFKRLIKTFAAPSSNQTGEMVEPLRRVQRAHQTF